MAVFDKTELAGGKEGSTGCGRGGGRGEGEGKERNMSPWSGEVGFCNFFPHNTQKHDKYARIVV